MSCKRWIWVVMGVLAMQAQADYKELDAIVAIVDDDVILASELLSRLAAVREQIER